MLKAFFQRLFGRKRVILYRKKQADVQEQKTMLLPCYMLTIGMYVRELDVPWNQTSFLFQGFFIENDEQLLEIRKVAREATVDLEKTSRDVILKIKPKKTKRGYKPVGGNMPYSAEDIRHQLSQAEDLHSKAIDTFTTLLNGVQAGGTISKADTEQTVTSFSDNLEDCSDALMWMLQIRDKDNLTAQHSVSVCVISMMMGRALSMRPDQIKELGVAALMHDVGKMKVPEVLLDPTLRYNQKAFVAMARHTVNGEKVLQEQGKHFPPSVAAVARHHHERWDGRGYPNKLAGTDIPLFARIVCIAEAYDAMTSAKSYRKSISAGEALKRIYEARGAQFDPEMVEVFIDCMGVYPPGTLLEMRNGEVGIVLSVNPADKLQPRILLVLDGQKMPRAPRVVDFKRADLDASGKEYKVRNLLPVGSYNIEVQDFLSPGLLFEVA